MIITPPAGAVAKYCDEYVCVCNCLFARICPEPHARSLPNFLWMLPMSVAQFSSSVVAIRLILTILWLTSFFYYNGTYIGMNFATKD